MPSHHDDLATRLAAGPAVRADLLAEFTRTVAAASPGSTVLAPEHLGTLRL